MNPRIMYEVVAPLLLIDTTAIICISTASGDSDNHYNEILSLEEEPGVPLFKQYIIKMACEPCIALGIVTKCPHMRDHMPPWQSDRKHKRIQKLYGSSRKALMERELAGVNTINVGYCFEGKDVRALFGKPRYFLDNIPIKKIFIAYDPNCGSEARGTPGSDVAILSTFEMNGATIICGYESINSYNPSMHYPRMIEHCKKLRSYPEMADAQLVFILENNTGQEAAHMEMELHKYLNNIIILSDKDLKTGVRTQGNKKEMMLMTRHKLRQDSLLLLDDKKIVCTAEKPNEVIEEFKNQLLKYQEIKIPPTSPIGKTSIGYTGKISPGDKDDMAMALQLNIYWKNWFWESPKYSRYTQHSHQAQVINSSLPQRSQ
jgi:hypothetical protein